MNKRILIALDPDPDTPVALDYAVSIARRFEAEVSGLTVVDTRHITSDVGGGIGFGAFYWMLQAGWSEPEARNALFLLMVLFENVHVGNSRSETKSVLHLSPLTSPILLTGVILAFSIHVAAMYIPLTQRILQTAPVDPSTWGVLILIAVSLLPIMEIHKWTWKRRHPS